MASYADPALSQNTPLTRQTSGFPFAALLVLVAGFLSVGLAYFFYVQTSTYESQRTKFDQDSGVQSQQLAALQPSADDLISYTTLSKSLHSLFDSQKLWEKVLANLEPLLYKHMSISSLQLNDQGALVISGTTPSYQDYQRIFDSLTSVSAKQYFSAVKPTAVVKQAKGAAGSGASISAPDLTAANSQIAFSFTMTLDQKILKATK